MRKRLFTAILCTLLTVNSINYGEGFVPGALSVYAEESVSEEAAPVETQKLTEAATEAPKQTEAPVETQKPTEAATEAPKQTEAPAETQKPTEAATEAPKQTEAPTETQKSTEVVTEAPKQTEAPTEAQKPTEAVTEVPETSPSTEAGTELPSETIPETSVTEESVTEKESELVTEENSSETGAIVLETETRSEETIVTESELESETETVIEDMTDAEGLIEEVTEEEKEETEEISNEELISRQNIVTPPDISLEFRFTQVEKVYAIVKNPEGTHIYEEKNDSSAVAGTIDYYGLCYILEDENSDWIYVESGTVRGFIAAGQIVTGEIAERIVNVRGEDTLPEAVAKLSYMANDAYTYTHTTTNEVVVAKVYALADTDLNILEEKKASARIVGTLEEGGLCYVIADRGRSWVYVESGNSRGFVKASQLTMGTDALRSVREKGETSFAVAQTQIEPEDNTACYYTLASIKEASKEAITRSDMVNFSFQFLGNPYVWGGTSLTNGCDCSGFTQSIYAHFGYYIPRVAEAQAVYGMQIPVSSAAPGDLIFYAKNGSVYHVSMYIGDGQVIHAYGKNTGIIISGIGSSAVWATRQITG